MKALVLFIFSLCSLNGLSQVSLSWNKAIGTPWNTSAIDHQVDASGNLFAFGKTKDTICGYDAFFISKLDLGGNEIHQLILTHDSTCDDERPSAFSIGNTNHILTCGTLTNNQGGALLYGLDTNSLSLSWTQNVGYYYVDCTHGFSNEDYVVGNYPPELQRWTETGSLTWSYPWVGTDANAFKTFIDQTNGVYMLVTTFNTSSSFDSGFGLVKRDTSNGSGWSMEFNALPGQINYPVDAVQDNSANTYVLTKELAGVDSIFLTKVSASGQALWTSTYGPCHFLYDLEYDVANNNILALVKVSGAIKVIRFDTSGLLIDTTCGITASLVYGNPVFDVDTLGNIYLAYDSGLSPNYTTSINKLNYGGGIVWNYQYPTSIPLVPSHLTVQSDGSVFTSLTLNYSSMLSDSIFVIKLDQPLSVTEENELRFNFSVFPNPTSDICFYQLSSNPEKLLRYEIFDIMGKVLLGGKCSSSGNGEIDLSTLSPSFYLISILNENGELVVAPQKIIKL